MGLDAGVNTAGIEAGAEYLQNAEDGTGNLYFNRAPLGGTADLYYASLTPDGDTRGPAVLIPELSDPTATDQGATLRSDGREIFSSRPAPAAWVAPICGHPRAAVSTILGNPR